MSKTTVKELDNRFSTEIILECMCYALEQAYSSAISIVLPHEVDTDEEQFDQLKRIVKEIDDLCVAWGVNEMMLDETIKWYDVSTMKIVRMAESFKDIYPDHMTV